LFGVETKIIPLREDLSLAVEDYAAFKGAVIIANPNAPTGLCLNKTQIAALLEQDPNRLVVIDEAYVDFGGESAVALIGRYDNLLVVQTLSKSRALAGARLGFAAGNKKLIDDLNTIKFSFNPYNVNALTQIVGVAALAHEAYFEQTVNEIVEARAYTADALKSLGFSVPDSKANFIFAGNHEKLSGATYFKKLRERNIIVRYFDTPREKEYVRISIGTKEQMKRFVDATASILKEADHAQGKY
jgi:histidinol-phosphate aminotransferase